MDWGDIVEIRCREEVDEEFAALDVLNSNDYIPKIDMDDPKYYDDPNYDARIDEMDFMREENGDASYYDENVEMDGGFGGIDMDYGDMDCGW